MADFSFITNHGLILAAIAKAPYSTARELGDAVGITERAAHRIVRELEKAGYISTNKVGRQNHYQIHPDLPITQEAGDVAVGELLGMLGWRRRKNRTKIPIQEERKEDSIQDPENNPKNLSLSPVQVEGSG